MLDSDVSVIIGITGSDTLLKPTLNSLSAAIEAASGEGITCRVTQVRIPEGRDPAPIRNKAVRAARGRYIAWIGCGDLISSNWISESVKLLKRQAKRRLVLHPELNVIFGGSPAPELYRSVDQEAPEFNPAGLVWSNYWTSLLLAERSVLLKFPFPKRRPGFSHETWLWNCDLLHGGVIHGTVPETTHFLRRGSVHAGELLKGDWRLPVYPSEFFSSPEAGRTPGAPTDAASDTSWLARHCQQAAAFEPDLGAAACHRLERAQFDDGALTPVFQQFLKSLGHRPDCLFVMHQLRRGGAELEAIAHVRAFRHANPKARVHFLTTELSDSDWIDQLPKGVKVLALGRETAQYFRGEDQVRLLLKLLLQIQPRSVHVKHSWQCWDLYKECNVALRTFSRLFASLYCIDYAADGSKVSFAYSHLRHCWRALQAVFCDNQALADHLKDVCGMNSLRVLRFPVHAAGANRPAQTDNKRRLRVLWASRLARQKNLSTLFSVAASMPEDEFHVYGEFSEPPPIELRIKLSTIPNLKYFGGFDGLDSIDVRSFDAFLYTSSWDGLPNILLEAGVKSLPVLAPRVGGIPELIHAETGFPADQPDEYVAALESIRENPAEAERRARNLKTLISRRHSFEAFCGNLRTTRGYLSP